MANSENVVNQLLGAIDTVVNKRLEQLSYDKTIICTIIDDSKAKNGEYQVTDGSVKFWAKCENTNYRNDEQVRVSVPNGDTTQEKFIIGKYVKDSSNTPITYMTPLGSVLKMSGDICNTQDSDVFGLQATGPVDGVPTKTGALLWTADVNEETAAMANSQIYDVIYIQADFKTTLSNYNITSGTYGLMLSLGTTLANGEPGPAVTCLFDSNQMLGNPYSFGIYTPQAAKFDITNVGKLSSVQLLFYQDGNFTHNTTTIDSVPLTYPKEISNMNNILIKNIKIGFGADVTNVADETVRLFTTDDLRYDNDSTTNAITNEKHLKFAWYNKDENGQYIGFNDGLDASGNVKWVNEDSYLKAAGHNAKLQAQQNYDIPMDEIGLSLAAETKTIRDTLLGVSKSLSIDLHALMSTLIDRCNIASIESYLKNIDDYVCQQALNLNGKTNLTEVANDCYDWYMNALNQAAAKYNQSILPTQVSGSWTFKGDGTNPGAEPGYHTGFSNFFEALYDKFYPIIDEETQERRFLNELYLLVTGDFTGYKGIYDNYNSRITKLLNQVWSKWELIGNPIEETGIDSDTGELVIIKPLGLLVDNKEAIENYFKANYSFTPWSAIELSDYDNGYAIYWYRYNPNASGDNFMPRGWERVTPLPADTRDGIVITCDAVNMEKEEFKVLIIYNHEKYESNVLTFENRSDVINSATALLSDKVIIKHGTNSQETYQSYGISNLLTNSADRSLRREFQLEFTHNNGAIDNSALINGQVYWYVPLNGTMLTYDTGDLLNLNPENNFTNDISSQGASEMHRDGYACFYKTIGYGNSANVNKDLKFSYRIKEYYTPTASQNTIYCVVKKDGYEYKAEALMTFATFGTSGTDYTLAVTPATRQAAITPSNILNNEWRLNIALYDNENKPVTDYALSTIELMVDNSKYSVQGPLSDGDGYYCLVRFEEKENTGVLCDILKVVASGVQHGESLVDLTTFFPIPYAANADYYIEGATTVIYDNQGGNPSYYKNPYKLFKQATPDTSSDAGEIAGTWNIAYSPALVNNMLNYMPVLADDGALLPSNMWVEGGDVSYAFLNEDDVEPTPTSHYTYVQCSDSSDNILWSQPILIIQNRYPSPMINAWDGKFKIDDENGTIMSTMISAGRKTSKNTFEGVMMGDIQGVGNTDNKSGLGIYGFNDGAQSFGLNIDGTAFFGKSGRGRLLFDGNSGTISSASYQQTTHRGLTPAGMMIDLDDGFIDMRGTEAPDANGNYTSNGTQSQIHLDVKSPYFYIKSKDGNELIHIGDNYDESTSSYTSNYYFQTNDYRPSSLWSGETFNTDGTSGLGMRLDLGDGRIDAYKFTLKGENSSGSYIALSDNDNAFLRIKYRTSDSDDIVNVDVMDVGVDTYQLHSFDWISGASGTELDFTSGRWVSYADVSTYDGKAILIAASAGKTPFAVGGSGSIDDIVNTAAFKINWDGSLAVGRNEDGTMAFTVSSTGQINVQDTAFQITPSGDLSLGAGAFSVDHEGNLNINDKFSVDHEGNLNINDKFSVDNEGNLNINDNAFVVTNIGDLSLGGGMFKVDHNGNLSLGIRNTDDGSAAVFFVSQNGELAINGEAFTISKDGDLSIGEDVFTVSKDGYVTAKRGNIGGAEIIDGKLTIPKGNIESLDITDLTMNDTKITPTTISVVTDVELGVSEEEPQSITYMTEITKINYWVVYLGLKWNTQTTYFYKPQLRYKYRNLTLLAAENEQTTSFKATQPIVGINAKLDDGELGGDLQATT